MSSAVELDVIAGHHHLSSFWKSHRSRYVCCTEIELRTVTSEERLMTATFFFCQNVNSSFEFCVRLQVPGAARTIPRSMSFFSSTAEKNTDVLTSTRFIENLVEHLKASYERFACFADTDELELIVNFDNTSFNAPCRNCSTA
jgi:hypothetical protein